MKEALAAIKGELLQIVLLLGVLGLAGYLIWRKLFGPKAPSDVAGDTLKATKDIVNGLPSVVGSVIRGESEAGYVSQDEFRRLSAEVLARTLAAKAQAGG